jgi:hypothetical protein
MTGLYICDVSPDRVCHLITVSAFANLISMYFRVSHPLISPTSMSAWTPLLYPLEQVSKDLHDIVNNSLKQLSNSSSASTRTSANQWEKLLREQICGRDIYVYQYFLLNSVDLLSISGPLYTNGSMHALVCKKWNIYHSQNFSRSFWMSITLFFMAKIIRHHYSLLPFKGILMVLG